MTEIRERLERQFEEWWKKRMHNGGDRIAFADVEPEDLPELVAEFVASLSSVAQQPQPYAPHGSATICVLCKCSLGKGKVCSFNCACHDPQPKPICEVCQSTYLLTYAEISSPAPERFCCMTCAKKHFASASAPVQEEHSSGISEVQPEQKVAEPTPIGEAARKRIYDLWVHTKSGFGQASSQRFVAEYIEQEVTEQTASLRSQLERATKYWRKFAAELEAAESALRQKELAIAAASNPEIRAIVAGGIESAKTESGIEVSALRSRESAIDYEVSALEILAMLWPNLNDTFHSKAKREIAAWLRSHDQKLRGRESQQEAEPTVGEVLREFEKFDTLTSKAAKLVYFRNLVEKHVRLRGRQSVTPQPQTESPKEKL